MFAQSHTHHMLTSHRSISGKCSYPPGIWDQRLQHFCHTPQTDIRVSPESNGWQRDGRFIPCLDEELCRAAASHRSPTSLRICTRSHIWIYFENKGCINQKPQTAGDLTEDFRLHTENENTTSHKLLFLKKHLPDPNPNPINSTFH